jgi:hypothetical protein
LQTLEGQLVLTSPFERDLLDVASVAGAAFDSQSVAAGLETSVATVEAACARLSRARHFLREAGRRSTWPDGSVGGRYAFLHTAYQQALRDLLPSGRRAALHRRIAGRLEVGYAGGTREIAPDLVEHFQRGHDHRRAVRYLRESAMHAYERGSFSDAAACFEAALEQLGDIAATHERAGQELELRQAYAAAQLRAYGYAWDALYENLVRALALAEQTGSGPARFDVLYALALVHANRGEYAVAERLGRQLLTVRDTRGIRVPWRAQYIAGIVSLWTGHLHSAQRWLAAVCEASTVGDAAHPWFGVDPIIGAASHDSLRLALAGSPADASAQQADAVARAERLGHPFTTAEAVTFAAILAALDRRWLDAASLATRVIASTEIFEFPNWRGAAIVCRGRALVGLGECERGLREIGTGLAETERAGVRLGLTLLKAFEAGACLDAKAWAPALQAVDDGLTMCRSTAERLDESTLWRLKAEALIGSAGDQPSATRRRTLLNAVRSVERAVVLARGQDRRTAEGCARRVRMRILAARAAGYRTTGVRNTRSA